MFAHVDACRKSKQPQKKYCKQHGLAYSTLQYWAKKYRECSPEDEVTDTTPGFIPVKVQPDPETDQVRIPGQLNFLFPNGVQVMCPDTVHTEVLRMLLNP